MKEREREDGRWERKERERNGCGRKRGMNGKGGV